MIKVRKRNGQYVDFDKKKIEIAILKAMRNGSGIVEPLIANEIAGEIQDVCQGNGEISISEIESMVFDMLIEKGQSLTAKAYEGYRKIREFQRINDNTTDEQIAELLTGTSDYWNKENSNKDAKLLTTQRDYMAGIVSTDITRRFLLPPDVVQAHDEGILHFHDADYFGQNAITNCCLINLEDMLQNGTCINDVLIEKPHRFITACTIATQIITAVTSSQYGGATITLTHLAPFVRDSYILHCKKHLGRGLSEAQSQQYALEDTRKEISDGVQTFNYQCNSMTTTNGQSPFLSVFMYLGETEEYKEELAMVIEEFLQQRIIGLKNSVGVYITQAFPKLLYVLEKDNITRESKYWYLTELSAKCTAKRMVPDYISEKVMLELKGDAYPCMGCVEGNEIITYKYRGQLYVESFKRMWGRLSDYFAVKQQREDSEDYLYMDTDGVDIYDSEKGFVNVRRVIKNKTDKWLNVKLYHGRSLMCTPDHPFHTERGRVRGDELKEGDIVKINPTQYYEETQVFDDNKAWLLGFLLCDGCYSGNLYASIAFESENDIAETYITRMKESFNKEVNVIERHRGPRGTYKDLHSPGSVKDVTDYLFAKFGGIAKARRHIPNEVYSWNYTAKLNFLAGMIDADGYINPTSHGGSIVQIGSTNKELALQQAALARALDMPSAVYQNHYNKEKPDAIRYRVEFSASEDLLTYIVSEKKRNNHVENETDYSFYQAKVNSVELIEGVDDYSYDVTTDSDHFEVSGIYSHNCRSFLTPDRFTERGVGNIAKAKNYEEGMHKYYGRFNQGVVTLNLVDIALSSNKNMDRFWEIFDERTELCHRALKCRHERLKGTVSDVAPILWQDGAFARLEKGEVVDTLLYNGYSTISLGYAGLYECVKYMTDNSHTDNGVGKEFAIAVMQALNDKCIKWKVAENIDYSLYGSPIESTTYKFAKCLKRRFGEIKGVTDKEYITNSYHVPVFEEIDPFTKLELESEFQKLSPGGAISYIECADLTHNIEAVLSVMRFIYDNIMYAELNTKSDYCQNCGFDGEIKIIDIDGQLDWECPNCGNRDHSKMNVSRRTCGYLGTNFWNQGRTQEIATRYVHLDDHALETKGSEPY